jgi:hypothetical protein
MYVHEELIYFLRLSVHVLVAHVGCRCRQFWGLYVVSGDMLATSRDMSARHLATLPQFWAPTMSVGTSTKSTIVLMYSVLR